MELSRRALNRATLHRQLLLERSGMSIPGALRHLVGIQAQTPHSWYVGLWSRLQGFDASAVGELLTERAIVRLALMRSTIHLVSAEDALSLRSWVQPVLDRDLFTNQAHGGPIAGVDVPAVIGAGRLALAAGPLTNKALGEILAAQWPECPPATLVYAVRNQLPLVQVPPRGIWGRSGSIAHTSAEAWLGRSATPAADAAAMVTRYLTAFGPASVRDIQTWSGLTKLREVVDAMGSRLVGFRDGDGGELFDVPDAPLPDEQTPAPPRFLYDFDNLLLSFADRSRVVTEPFGRAAFRGRRPAPQIVLVDGFTAGGWTVSDLPDGGKRVTIEHFHERFTDEDAAAFVDEGVALLTFLAPDAPSRDVVFERVTM